jgi:hypothetical protein
MKNAKTIDGRILYPVYTGTEKMASIHSDSRAIREVNRLKIKIYKLSGQWNGYGYDTLDRFITATDAKKIRVILKKIDKKNERKNCWLCSLLSGKNNE